MKFLWLIAIPVILVLLLAIGRGRRRKFATATFLDYLAKEWPKYSKKSEFGHTLILTHADGGEYELDTLQLANAVARSEGTEAAIFSIFEKCMRQLDELEREA